MQVPSPRHAEPAESPLPRTAATSAPTPASWPGPWRTELRRAATSGAELGRTLRLSPAETEALRIAERDGWAPRVTPYYLGLCDPSDPRCPIRRQIIPAASEGAASAGERVDPLDEQGHEVAPRLVRRYPDRALLLVTDCCAGHCRFCTRSRAVGRGRGVAPGAELEHAFEYLRAQPEIREVIVSGGDPLTMSTARLCAILEGLRRIEHLEVIRLGTRAPVYLPSRVTRELVRALQPFGPLWIMTHFNHPRELTAAAERACARLVDGGFPVNNQTVLLRGVNDDRAVLEQLFRGLVRWRVRPYYLMQMDPVAGSAELRTPLAAGIELMAQLQGRLSGIALPKLVLDTPGGFGKVPLGPQYVLSSANGRTRLRTPTGRVVEYVDPPPTSMCAASTESERLSGSLR